MAAACLLAPAESRGIQSTWGVVHERCLPAPRTAPLPRPCVGVNRRAGYAILKESNPFGYLLVPIRRLTGIEDPRLLGPGVPNFWAEAWAARRYVIRRAGGRLPREDVGLAINGLAGRTQDQLHIHVNCVRTDVRDALAAASGAIGARWSSLQLRDHSYSVRSLGEAELAGHDPFRLLAADGPAGRTPLADQTMALIGRAAAPGAPPSLFLLAAAASRANHGHAEELLDHDCKAAKDVAGR